MGTGLGHYIPLVAYLGFWLVSLASLTGRPIWGLYYVLPFLPYRTMRDHFEGYPLGSNMVTIVLVCMLVGALLQGKRPPRSKLYLTWFLFILYLYFSMWIGAALGNAPAPLWISDANFTTWKDYTVLPLLFLAAGMVLEDRKQIRTVILITAGALFLVDRSALLESLSHSWAVFDESKRTSGPIEFGPNQLAAFLAQFGMFFWACATVIKRKKVKLVLYALTGLTMVTVLYCFSRGAYIAVLAGAFVLALLKARKLLVVLAIFLFTWQAIVPTAVTERVSMTHDAHGQLDLSAQERVDLWKQSEQIFLSSPVVGAGFATFQYSNHTDNLKDTHNYFVKVLVETGVVGFIFFAILIYQMLSSGYRLFRRAEDPLYQALGLAFTVAVVSCLVANCFGDRWTYVEINGLLWVLAGGVVRTLQMVEEAKAPAALSPAAALSPMGRPPLGPLRPVTPAGPAMTPGGWWEQHRRMNGTGPRPR